MINYHNKIFAAISNTENGAVETGMLFHYQQNGHIVTCSYAGATIQIGHLMALVDAQGHLDMRYHQVHIDGTIMAGTCISKPEILPDGRIRLNEKWRWTTGDGSAGESILEEKT
jgi:hypothetical protein